MMANTWVDVHRGDDGNIYADITDLDTPVPGLERVAMSVTEQSRTVYDRETAEARTVRYAVGRARYGVDIQKDDRLHDQRSGKWWAVREVTLPGYTWTGARQVQYDLRAV